MLSPIRHLYLHVPFCHRICPYCSFYKHQPGGTDQAAFLSAVVKEAELARASLGDRLDLKTIYWGGGTPSLLSAQLLETFLPNLLEALGNPKPVEWTVEMNPKTLTSEKLKLMRHHGVTRASLGVQAWDEPTLKILGRDHSPTEGKEAFSLLRDAGFPAVSIDLMFAIPKQSLDDWKHSLETSISLQPDHISCYNLTYEEDTAYFEKFTKGDYLRDEGVDEAFFGEAMKLLGTAGFNHYEISNHAKPGFESQHNQSYWRGADYLGLGPSAVSTMDRIRTKNIPDTAVYISKIQQGERVHSETEHLTADQWKCERLALELRTREGISLELVAGSEEKVRELEEAGLVMKTQNRLILTKVGKMVADSVVEHLWV